MLQNICLKKCKDHNTYWTIEEKAMRNMVSWVIVKVTTPNQPEKETISLMSKSITLRHGLSAIPNEVLARKWRRRAVAGSTTRAGRTSTSGSSAGMVLWRPWPVSPDGLIPPQPAYRGRAEAHPRYAPPGIQPWVWSNSGTVCGSAATPAARRVCSVSCVKWGCSCRKAENTYKPKPYEQMTYPGERVQVDAEGRAACASRIRTSACSSTPPSTRFTPALLATYPEQSTILRLISCADRPRGMPPWDQGGVCPDGQWLRVHQPFSQQ